MSELMLARVPDGGRPVFWFDPRPGDVHFAVGVSPTEFEAVLERGFARLDGQVARPVLDDCDRETGFLRLRFDLPYVAPGALRAVA